MKQITKVLDFVSSMKDRLSFLAVMAMAALMTQGVLAQEDPVVLPATGVNVPGYITALVTMLGGIAGAAIAAWAAFFAIRKGLRWVRSVG